LGGTGQLGRGLSAGDGQRYGRVEVQGRALGPLPVGDIRADQFAGRCKPLRALLRLRGRALRAEMRVDRVRRAAEPYGPFR
jgi:hypothetical protein